MTVLMSRMEGFDKSLEEASLDLGESGWMTFWRVTFPLVLPGIISSLLLTFIVSFDEFLIAYFLAGTRADAADLYLGPAALPLQAAGGAGAGRAASWWRRACWWCSPNGCASLGVEHSASGRWWEHRRQRGRSLYLRSTAVTKRFGGVTAVDAADIAIARGEFFSLLGPSGCGKTTLLRMIAGFEYPDRRRDLYRRRADDRSCRRTSGRPTWCSSPMRSFRTSTCSTTSPMACARLRLGRGRTERGAWTRRSP